MNKRHCRHCFRDHLFDRGEDDRTECPRCGGDLDVTATRVLTEVDVEAAILQDEMSVSIENALDDDAITIWNRVDDAERGTTASLADVAGRIARRLVDGLRPTISLVSAAREFARADKMLKDARREEAESLVQVTRMNALTKTTRQLHDAATALEYGCQRCGSQLVRLDDNRLCPDCRPLARDPEGAFDARCRDALAAFKGSPERFAEAARSIAAERPGITIVEFFERATRTP